MKMETTLAVLLAVLVAGCVHGPAGSAGRAVFLASDRAMDTGNVTRIQVTIDSIQVHSTTQGWITVSSTPKTIDLLRLKASGAHVLLANTQLANGTYEQMRLHISQVVVTDSTGDHETKLPSGDLKIVGGFNVSSNSTSLALFDFKADRSLHRAGNGMYILAPVVHLQIQEGVEVDEREEENVKIRNGRMEMDEEMGMDERGQMGRGMMIAVDKDLEVDENGSIHARMGEGNGTQEGR